MFIPNRDSQGNVIQPLDAFASNTLQDGKVLYLKIHGMKTVIAAGATYEFQYTIPYTEVYLQGAEIYVDVLGQTNLGVKHPVAGMLEQYGFGVVMGRFIYKEKAQYASRLPQGLIVSVEVTNPELVEQEYGVNIIMHEIREPNG